MSFVNILGFAMISLLAGAWPRARAGLALFASLLALYWMQPAIPIRNLDFWLPTASIGLSACIWIITFRRKENPVSADRPQTTFFQRIDFRGNLGTVLILLGVILAVALSRYLNLAAYLTPSTPPELSQVITGLLILLILMAGLSAVSKRRWVAPVAILVILGIFLILKTDALAQAAAGLLRRATGQSAALASAMDIRWLGFSYLAFRQLHVLRDRMTGRLPECSLREFMTYSVFFPAIASGPIDRVERFLTDLRSQASLSAPTFLAGGERIVMGIFKKFIIADTLAILALTAVTASQIHSTFWMWICLYAYAFRIYFDFSGYIDIALGLSRWMGFALPENFNRPYLQSNLTAFWNSWHITLAQWFRSYFFNPLTRALRSSRKLPVWVVILVAQLATMVLIGLWHGVTWNFALWGCWHGAGLFIHNRWGEWSRDRVAMLESRPAWKKTYTALSTLLTFHYVVLGWVWFALPSVESSGKVFLRLFGISG
ncbi:MAG TPA: MBOAT family O-acyltransferase [Anaerolineales bacterium]